MKYLILALLVAFSTSATAGKPTKEQFDNAASAESNAAKPCASGVAPKGSTVDVQKGPTPKGAKACDDGTVSKRAPTDAPSKTNPPAK